MNLDFDSLSDAEIIGLLGRTGTLPTKGEVHLQRYPVNANRKDAKYRISMRVWAGSEAVIHLTIGRGLTASHRKAVAFHRHNPEIAVRPLFFIRHAGVDFFGQECPGLFNLDEALASRRIDASAWRDAVARVASALAATNRPSTPALLLRECARFEAAVLSIEALTNVDAVFLRNTVFPLIRLEASRRPAVTAWSNGDFIAKNIILDGSGRPRLVDYEFASRTHFSPGDWFRLRRFSNLPADTTMADFGAPPTLSLWLELWGWLDHAVKMVTVCSPEVVHRDLPKVSEQILRLLEPSAETRSNPLFFDLRSAEGANARNLPASYEDGLIVEWAGRNGDRFRAEPPVALRAGQWNEIQVDLSAAPGRALLLRLRLPESPCILEFRRIEVYGRERSQVLWTVDPAQLHLLLSCTGNLLDIPTAEGMGIIHFGGESHVTLPFLRVSRADLKAGVHLVVRFEPRLHDFAQGMRRAATDGKLPSLLGGSPGHLLTAGVEPKPAFAQLFRPTDHGYDQENSQILPITDLGTWIELAFEVPPQREGAILRFDPIERPGLLDVSSLNLAPASDNGLPPAVNPRDWVAGIACEGDAVFLPTDEGVRVLIFGSDPILKLAPIPPALAGKPLHLKVCLRFNLGAPVSAWAGALTEKHAENINLHIRLHQIAQDRDAAGEEALSFAQAATAQAQQETRTIQEEQDKTNRALAEALDELARTRKKLEDVTHRSQEDSIRWESSSQALEKSKSELLESLYAQNTHIADLQHRLEIAAEVSDRRIKELSSKHSQSEDDLIAQHKERFAAAMADRNQCIAGLEGELDAARRRITGLESDLAATRERLATLESILGGLRERVFLRLDPAARRLLDSAESTPPPA